MRVSRSGPALLLFLLVTAGLFTMHTLGHSGTSEPGPMHHAPDMVAPMGMEPAGPDGATFGPSWPDPAMPMGFMVLCVAILCGVTALAVIAVVARRRRVRPPAGRCAGPIESVVRGPPIIPVGLVIADRSVLRN